MVGEYMGTSPEGYANWLAWAACEVDESNPVENKDEWEWNEDLKCYERKNYHTFKSRI